MSQYLMTKKKKTKPTQIITFHKPEQDNHVINVRKYAVKFCGKPEFMGAGKKHTHKIVNGVRPMLPTSPDLLQIFYYQPGKFYKLITHTPIPNTLRNYS